MVRHREKGTALRQPSPRRQSLGTREDLDLPDERSSRRRGDPIEDPAPVERHEVTKVGPCYPSVGAWIQPIQVREQSPPYGGG